MDKIGILLENDKLQKENDQLKEEIKLLEIKTTAYSFAYLRSKEQIQNMRGCFNCSNAATEGNKKPCKKCRASVQLKNWKILFRINNC